MSQHVLQGVQDALCGVGVVFEVIGMFYIES